MRTKRISQCLAVGASLSVLVSLLAIARAGGAETEKKMQAEAERIVSQYKTVFNAPPSGVPSRDSARGLCWATATWVP